MSEKEAFYRRGPQADSFDDEIRPGMETSNSLVNDSFLRISNCLEETDIFVSASRKYIDATKQTIIKLKNLITHVETDLNTADECVKETESRMQILKQELQAQSNLSFYEILENPLSGGRPDMYFYASKTLQECDEKVQENSSASSGFLERSGDFAASTSRLQQNRSLDDLMLRNTEEIIFQNRYGCKFSRSCDDCRNTGKKLIHSGSRKFTSQNLSTGKEHSRTVFARAEGELIYNENACDNGSNDFATASSATGVNVSSMQDMSDEVYISENAIGVFFNDRVTRQNRTFEIGHPFPNHARPCKASFSGCAASNKVLPSKEMYENIRTEKHSERHSTDYNAIKSFLERQKDEQRNTLCEDIILQINKRIEQIYEQSSSDSSDDLTPLLKERNKMEDSNSEANLLNDSEVCRRTADASSEEASSNCTEELRLRNERITKLLKDYKGAVPVNTRPPVYTSQKSLPENFDDGEMLIHGEIDWVRNASLKEGKPSKKGDSLSVKDLDTRRTDLNSKEPKLLKKSFLKNSFRLSNSGKIKRISQENESNYLDVDCYHSQKISTPNSIHENKATNTDLSFCSTLNIGTCVSCTKECLNQQDEPRVSEYFTCGSVSNSTANENDDDPNKKDSGDSLANSFENPSYISFNEDVSYPTLPWYEDISGCDSYSKCSASGFCFNAFDDDPLKFEKKCSLSNCNDSSVLTLGTSNVSAESECQTSPMSDDLRIVEESSTSSGEDY